MGENCAQRVTDAQNSMGAQRAAGKGVLDGAASSLAGGWGRTDEVVAAKTEMKTFPLLRTRKVNSEETREET